MKDTIVALWGLQKLDLEILEIEKRLKDLPAVKEKILEKVKEIDDVILKKESEREVISNDKTKLENEIEEENKKIKTVESRLGSIRNPKEYQEIRKKVELAKKANRLREDEVLKKMEQIENLTKELEELLPKLTEERKKIEESLKVYDQEEQQLNKAKEELTSRRTLYSEKIPLQVFKKYEFLREKSRGIAVCQAKNEACDGCFMNLPPQLYNLILKGDNLYNCPYCQRFLVYIKEETEETKE